MTTLAAIELLETTPGIIALFGVGLVLVIKGGDIFVGSSVAIAAYAHISRAVIGGTLVSLATTAPELVVSATASFQHQPGLAIGNAVGSAIANIGVILGLLCVIHPMEVRPRDFRVPAFVMLAGGVLLGLLTWVHEVVGGGRPGLGRGAGASLLALGLGYLAVDYWRHRPRAGARAGREEAAEGPSTRLPTAIAMFVLGAAMVGGGSRLLCDSAVKLATLVGVPPMIIGLTLVAFGTSLPELVTAVTAARKGVPELSLGNILGANIMNITLVTGTAASIYPLAMSRRTQLYNFPAMVALFALLILLAHTGRRLTRREGYALLSFYAAYLVGLMLLAE